MHHPARSAPRLLLRGVALAYVLLGALALWGVNEAYGTAFRAATNTQDGTYSDFSQRWLGTRVALFERGDPYSPALLPRIQALYYGHALSNDDPHRPRDPQGFFYPLYVVWVFWPLALLPFPLASALFKVLAGGLLLAGTRAWLDLLGWPRSGAARWGLAGLGLLTVPGQALITSDQPTVLIYGLLLGTLWALNRGRWSLAGVLLALSWIKPQLALLLTVGLALWALPVPARRRMLPAFTVTMGVLLVGSELWQPGWIGAWLPTLSSRPGGVAGVSSAASLTDWLGFGLRAGLAGGTLLAWWPVRRLSWSDLRLLFVAALTLVITVVVQQPWYTYNLIFLYPPALLLLSALTRALPAETTPPRMLGWLTIAVLAAPWGIYGVLYGIELAGVLPGTGVGWPSFAALALLIGTLLSALTVLAVLFTYLAWIRPMLRPRPPRTVKSG